MRHVGILLLCVFSAIVHADDLLEARRAINQMEYEQAIVLLEKHLKSAPDDEATRNLLARTYAWDNQFEPAAREYTRLLTISPDNTDYLYNKAQALLWLDNNAEALPVLEKAWQLDNDNAEVWKTYILVLGQSKDAAQRQRAQALVKQAREKFPQVEWNLILN